jgi:bifunctional non-homologous end joining protein LigD
MFCVQKHLASHLHYDFRLEHNGVLLSWAVPKGPSLNPRDKRLAMQTEDHPLDYGDFEGVIPEGYGAGIVMLWDRGTWEPKTGDVDRALKNGELKFRLEGIKLKGSWVLVRTRGYSKGGPSRSWLLIKHRDEWSGPLDVTEAAPLSVKSFGEFADILASGNTETWESHKPGGGVSGKMLEQIIEQAARIRAGDKLKPKKPPRTASGAGRTRSVQKSRVSASGGKKRSRQDSNLRPAD